MKKAQTTTEASENTSSLPQGTRLAIWENTDLTVYLASQEGTAHLQGLYEGKRSGHHETLSLKTGKQQWLGGANWKNSKEAELRIQF